MTSHASSVASGWHQLAFSITRSRRRETSMDSSTYQQHLDHRSRCWSESRSNRKYTSPSQLRIPRCHIVPHSRSIHRTYNNIHTYGKRSDVRKNRSLSAMHPARITQSDGRVRILLSEMDESMGEMGNIFCERDKRTQKGEQTG